MLISAPRYYALSHTVFKFPHSVLSANFATSLILHLDAAAQSVMNNDQRNTFNIIHGCAVHDPAKVGKFRTFLQIREHTKL